MGYSQVPTKNLVPGQYQIGDLVFGRGTIYPVNNVEIQSYNTAPQDFPVQMSDEISAGQDSLQGAPIIFNIGVIDNYVLPNMAALTGVTPGFTAEQYALHKLAKEWRGDDVRRIPGAMKPLICCERDGRVLRWYGRPRKFQPTKRSKGSQFFIVQAEYMRFDTLQYSDEEYGIVLNAGGSASATRGAGDMPAWFRVLLVGPAVHPIVTIGSLTVNLDYTLAAGEQVEISSYPHARRVINNGSPVLNLAAKLIGATPYLNQLLFYPGASSTVSWSATGTSGASKCYFLWREAWSVMA